MSYQLIEFSDCNNLYGFVMLKKLPHHGFTWMKTMELENLNFDTFDVEGDISLVLEVCMISPL